MGSTSKNGISSKKATTKTTPSNVTSTKPITKKTSPEERELKNKEIDSHKHYSHTSIDLILDDHEERLLVLEEIIGNCTRCGGEVLGPTIPKQEKVLLAVKAPNQGDELVYVSDD